MKITLFTLVLTFACFAVKAKEIAITFDDSPRFARGLFDGPTRANKLIKNLHDHKVNQVAFFSVGKNLNEEGKSRLHKYAKAGHIIANHTYSHANINELDLAAYEKDFLQAHDQLQPFDNFKKMFRFPYLREGNSVIKRDGMRKALKNNGYTNAYITINNYDWHMETLFQKALKDNNKLDMEKMRRFYVQVLMEGIEFYDELAIKVLGRSPKHVILLHEMDISALFIGDLINALRHKGWKIITPAQAYTDEIAQYQTPSLFPYNPGRIGEIAKDKGQTSGLWHKACDQKYLDERFAKEVL